MRNFQIHRAMLVGCLLFVARLCICECEGNDQLLEIIPLTASQRARLGKAAGQSEFPPYVEFKWRLNAGIPHLGVQKKVEGDWGADFYRGKFWIALRETQGSRKSESSAKKRAASDEQSSRSAALPDQAVLESYSWDGSVGYMTLHYATRSMCTKTPKLPPQLFSPRAPTGVIFAFKAQPLYQAIHNPLVSIHGWRNQPNTFVFTSPSDVAPSRGEISNEPTWVGGAPGMFNVLRLSKEGTVKRYETYKNVKDDLGVEALKEYLEPALSGRERRVVRWRDEEYYLFSVLTWEGVLTPHGVPLPSRAIVTNPMLDPEKALSFEIDVETIKFSSEFPSAKTKPSFRDDVDFPITIYDRVSRRRLSVAQGKEPAQDMLVVSASQLGQCLANLLSAEAKRSMADFLASVQSHTAQVRRCGEISLFYLLNLNRRRVQLEDIAALFEDFENTLLSVEQLRTASVIFESPLVPVELNRATLSRVKRPAILLHDTGPGHFNVYVPFEYSDAETASIVDGLKVSGIDSVATAEELRHWTGKALIAVADWNAIGSTQSYGLVATLLGSIVVFVCVLMVVRRFSKRDEK